MLETRIAHAWRLLACLASSYPLSLSTKYRYSREYYYYYYYYYSYISRRYIPRQLEMNKISINGQREERLGKGNVRYLSLNRIDLSPRPLLPILLASSRANAQNLFLG